MKRFVLMILLLPLLLYGCNTKSFDYQNVQRDNYNTGGNLTFVYDEISHTAYFGGEGEIVQFYTQDVAKGWKDEGCRIGVKILVPNEVDDFKSGNVIVGDEKLNLEEVVLQVDDSVNYAVFQPIVSQQTRRLEIKITWQEGYQQQIYHIVIQDETIFMNKTV